MFEFFPAAPEFLIGMGNTFPRYCYDTIVINFQAIPSLTETGFKYRSLIIEH